MIFVSSLLALRLRGSFPPLGLRRGRCPPAPGLPDGGTAAVGRGRGLRAAPQERIDPAVESPGGFLRKVASGKEGKAAARVSPPRGLSEPRQGEGARRSVRRAEAAAPAARGRISPP